MSKATVLGKTTKADLPRELFAEPFHQSLVHETARADLETPSTKAAAQALAKWGAKLPTLLVLDAEETGALKSFRNIARVEVAEVGAIGVADVIGAASLVLSEKALATLGERLS